MSIEFVTLRPDSTSESRNVLASDGGSAIHNRVNDQSDSDWVQCTPTRPNWYMDFGLDNPPDPGYYYRVRVTLRTKRLQDLWTLGYYVIVYRGDPSDPNDWLNSWDPPFSIPSTDSEDWEDRVSRWTIFNWVGELTEIEMQDVRIRIIDRTGVTDEPSPHDLLISNIEVEFAYSPRNVPTTTTLPPGLTTTTSPPPEVLTWDPDRRGIPIELSNSNLRASHTEFLWESVAGTVGRRFGKWYWEHHIENTRVPNGEHRVGATRAGFRLDNYRVGMDTGSCGYEDNGDKIYNNFSPGYGCS